jgi:hypothetical protein
VGAMMSVGRQSETQNEIERDDGLGPFTREDEKALFDDSVDPLFLENFQKLCSENAESCILVFAASIVTLSFHEIQTRGRLNLENLEHVDFIEIKLKFPVAALSKLNTDALFANNLVHEIYSKRWKQILQANPNYKCAVCEKPALKENGVLEYNEDDKGYRMHVNPCFPHCESKKCGIITTKCLDNIQMTEGTLMLSVIGCDSCDRVLFREELMSCPRCGIDFYCSTHCQDAHRAAHKKDCKAARKLVTCHHCANLDTTETFHTCSGCRQVFYCTRDCQVADWSNHKKICKKK